MAEAARREWFAADPARREWFAADPAQRERVAADPARREWAMMEAARRELTLADAAKQDRAAGYAIRKATVADRERLEPLVRAYIDFYEEPQPSAERLDGLLALLAERPEVGVQFVAERDGELHGFATVYLTYDTVAARPIAIMNDLFVAPDDRNVGLGRALIRQCHEFARENDCAVLQWITADDNATAQALYDKLGQRTSWVTYSMDC